MKSKVIVSAASTAARWGQIDRNIELIGRAARQAAYLRDAPAFVYNDKADLVTVNRRST